MKTQLKKTVFMKSAFLIVTMMILGFTSVMAQTDSSRKTSPYPQTEPMNPNQTTPPARTQPANPNQTTPPDQMNPNQTNPNQTNPNQTNPNQTNPNQHMNMKDTSRSHMNQTNTNSKLTPEQMKKIVGNDQKAGKDAQGNQLYKDSSGKIYYIDASGNKVYKK